MKILKAKVTKDSTLIATYRNDDGDTLTHEGKNLVTSDLLNAFKDLIPHLAFLCELKEADGKESLDELPETVFQKLEVSGYTVGGDGDDEGVTLIGKRFLQSKKVLNLNSPFTKFSNENEEYSFAFDLSQAIFACEYEVKEYLFNKKWRMVQQELPFDEEQAKEDIPADFVQDAVTLDSDFKEELEMIADEKSISISKQKKRGRNITTIKLGKDKQLAS